jgi:pimeloyl-ACP methyl ester carboxylesterase
MSEIAERDVSIGDLRLHYREGGTEHTLQPPVLLLHGWPTSSFLWRNVMPAIARVRRVVAVDLPGFGASDKPLDTKYGFRFHESALDRFTEALGIDRLSLGVHDLGGPIGLHWAIAREQRIERLMILNTIVYPEMSLAVKAFVAACRLPGARRLITSRWGLERALRLGVGDPSRLRSDAMEGFCAPFATADARTALARAGFGLRLSGFAEIAAWMRTVRMPVRIVYGERDWILPDIATTVERLRADVPQAEVTSLPDCGHFLQEDRPEEIGELLAAFLRD